ncbi:hypothetical protein D9M68_148810 [compost metagenome]
MQPTIPAPQEPTLAQKQAQLAENLAKADRALARCLARTAPHPAKASPSRTTSSKPVTTSCASAPASRSVLTLLDLQCGSVPESICLHALLSPLKQQLGQNADRLQSLV